MSGSRSFAELRQDLGLELMLAEALEAGAPCRERVAEDLARPVELAADLVLGLPEHVADLLVGEVADPLEKDERPLLLRESVERPLDLVAELALSELALGRLRGLARPRALDVGALV